MSEPPNASPEETLCLVVRHNPEKGIVWSEKKWTVNMDHRLFAVGVNANGDLFAIRTTMCEAVENAYRMSATGTIPERVEKAIRALRQNNDAELITVVQDNKSHSLKLSKTRT